MQTTKIQWTDMSWNPIRARRRNGGQRVPGHYCEKISSGCANCYASRMQKRFRMPAFGGTQGNDEVEPYLSEKALADMLRSRKAMGKKVFVCDMTDVFGRWVPDEWIDRIFAVMALRPEVTFQILTKRPERMVQYFRKQALTIYHTLRYRYVDAGKFATVLPAVPPLPNVWLGTSVENQETADERIPHLLRVPAAVRFLSVEPLLGAIDVVPPPLRGSGNWLGPATQSRGMHNGVDWAIIGGESGPGARPCDIAHIRSLVQQCQAAGVPCFVKQLGSDPLCNDADREEHEDGTLFVEHAMLRNRWHMRLRDKKGGDMSEWPEDLRVREFPKQEAK